MHSEWATNVTRQQYCQYAEQSSSTDRPERQRETGERFHDLWLFHAGFVRWLFVPSHIHQLPDNQQQ